MEEIQKLLNEMLRQVPYQLLEKRLAEKFKVAGIKATGAEIKGAAVHILSGSEKVFRTGDDSGDQTIEVTTEDLKYVLDETERFHTEELDKRLEPLIEKMSDDLYGGLVKNWPKERRAQFADMKGFKQRLELRWGEGLDKLRMMLTLVREWAQGAHERHMRTESSKRSYRQGVLLRLHVRACQVTTEIIVLLENGLADGAMARWRTLHEIAIVAAVIAKHGDDMAERYMRYQIVESYKGLKAYEDDHKGLGFKAPSKKIREKVEKGYAEVIKLYGPQFGKEYGWAAKDLAKSEKDRLTFARLEEEAGDAFMRSPYKMASYNVHASPKGAYFRLGAMDQSKNYIAGVSNAGLTDPAQHTAVSLAEITWFAIGDSLNIDDRVTANIIKRLEFEIPGTFWEADKKLKDDHDRVQKERRRSKKK